MYLQVELYMRNNHMSFYDREYTININYHFVNKLDILNQSTHKFNLKFVCSLFAYYNLFAAFLPI